jgi:hypothetical protein
MNRKIAWLALPLVLLALVLGVKSHAEPPRPTQSYARQFSISTVIYLPIRGGLRKTRVASTVISTQTRLSGDRTPLLNEVIRLAPHYFPPRARVLSVDQRSLTQSHFLINLNRWFSNSKFWKYRNRDQCRLAFHSLARNAAFINEGKGIPLPVRFVIEGKLVPRIGSFQTKGLLEPANIIQPGKVLTR